MSHHSPVVRCPRRPRVAGADSSAYHAAEADRLASAVEDVTHSVRCGCDVALVLRRLRATVQTFCDQLLTRDRVSATACLAVAAVDHLERCSTAANNDAVLTDLAAAADTLGQLHVLFDEACNTASAR